MDKKKGIILAVVIILIVGLGIFVFANPSNESLNDNNNSNNNTQNDDNENLDNENTNDDSQEGEDVNSPSTGSNNGGSNVGSTTNNDQTESSDTPSEPTEPSTPSTPSEPAEPSTPTTPSEPAEPSTPTEPDIDTSYEEALKAVIKAEESLNQMDVDSALTLVNALEASDDKTGLTSRLQAVQNTINAIALVAKAQTTFTQEDVNIASALVSSLVDSDTKTNLLNSLSAVQDTIDAATLVESLQQKTESATDINTLNDARSFRETEGILALVEALEESYKKEELANTLATLALILDDQESPSVSGLENNAITNDTSLINITDKNDVTIFLNNEEVSLEALTQNTLTDGTYTLVVRDAAYNQSEELIFEVDKTAPKISGLDNATYNSEQNIYLHNKNLNITVRDAHLISVEGLDGEIVNNAVSQKIANGTRHIIATDAAGNKTEVTIMVNKNIADIITITNDTELKAAIDNQADNQYWLIKENTYTLYQGDKFITEGGQAGWFFPITASNLTIVGEGNVTIKAGEDVINSNLATQNFVTIWGNNVKLDNLTLIAQNETNKAIEIMGDNTTLTNIEINPKDANDDYSGSIYVNKKGITTTLTNVSLNKGRITLTGTDNTNIVYLNNVKADLAGSSVEGVDANGNVYASFNNTGNAQVIANGFTVTISNKLTSIMNELLTSLPAGTTVILSDGTYELGHLEVNNKINLKGTSVDNTILQVNSDPISGQAGVYVKENGSISDLTIISSTDLDALKISGNTSGSITDYKVSNIKVIGGKSGINIHGVKNATIDGVNVSEARGKSVSIASSNVTITNSTLALAGWGTAVTIEYNPDNLASYPSASVVTIATNNDIKGPILATYVNYDNRFIFEDELAWSEIPYGENNSAYILNTES